jgi:hypothetical protein
MRMFAYPSVFSSENKLTKNEKCRQCYYGVAKGLPARDDALLTDKVTSHGISNANDERNDGYTRSRR